MPRPFLIKASILARPLIVLFLKALGLQIPSMGNRTGNFFRMVMENSAKTPYLREH